MEQYSLEEQPLDFDDFANQLLEQGAEQSPSQIHGGMCGVLCGGVSPDGQVADAEYCLAAVAQALQMDIHGELAVLSLRLAAVTVGAVQDEAFDFHIFLPDDEVEIEVRVRALSDWCEGFLSGYAMTVAIPDGAAVNEDTSEILKDISAIASADPEPDSDDEPDEDAEEEAESHFFELTEYLRFATLNVFMDRLVEEEESASP
jgi:uncharacterized protein YgfB (UPF0149 family)